MNGKVFRNNNRGASLILVIGCIALLSVIGSMLLVVTANNREMKELERQAQQTFYEAESGSDEMVSQLEIEAETALKRAFSDMMLQYSVYSSDAERKTRFADFFKIALEQEIQGSGAAETLMRKALGLNASDPLDVTVSFGGVTTETSGTADNTDIIRIQDAAFSYTAANGSQTKITTDICIQAKIPDVEKGINGDAVLCDFTDFALITGGDINSNLSSTQIMTVTGNLYTRNSIDLKDIGLTMKIKDAEKILVGKELKVSNKAILDIENSSTASGAGVWATGVTVESGGKLTAKSNFYVSDDLTISGTGSKAEISGSEYIGYSGGGNGDDRSAQSSAITINTAKDITLDLSGLTDLVLNGSSYIHDMSWANDAEFGDANKYGVLQGESVAYKNMQSMYLVPGECLTVGHNPMLKSEYEAKAGAGAEILQSKSFTYIHTNPVDGVISEETFNLEPYLDSTQPYVVRQVRLNGGTTTFVYLYLNFADESKAKQYFKDYMETDLADPIKKQLENLGSSTLKLAQNNYTLSNAISYDGGTFGIEEGTTSYSYLGTNSLLAKSRRRGLFTCFRMNAASSVTGDYDIIGNAILKMDVLDAVPEDVWQKSSFTVDGKSYDFWVYNGNVEITGNPNINGIMLVNGTVTFKASPAKIEGLVIATGGVSFNSQTEITADRAAVEALLKQGEVAKFFRGYGAGGGATPYLSSNAVQISFENWTKN